MAGSAAGNQGRLKLAIPMVLAWVLALLLGLNGVVTEVLTNYRLYGIERPLAAVGLMPLADHPHARRVAPIAGASTSTTVRYGDRLVSVGRQDVHDLSWPVIVQFLNNYQPAQIPVIIEQEKVGRISVLLSRRKDPPRAIAGMSMFGYFLTQSLIAAASGGLIILIAVTLFVKRFLDVQPYYFSVGMLLYPSVGIVQYAGSWRIALDTSAIGIGLVEIALLLAVSLDTRQWRCRAAILLVTICVAVRQYSDGPLIAAFTLLIPVAILVSFFVTRPPNVGTLIERQQLRWIATGAALAAIAIGILPILDVAQPFHVQFSQDLWFNLIRESISGLASVAFCVGVLVALVRYRLYDVELFVSNTLVYGFLSIFLALVFALTERVITALSDHKASGQAGLFSGGILFIAGGALIGPIHDAAKAWVKERFQSGISKLERDIPLLIIDLREIGDLKRLLSEGMKNIQEAVRSTKSAVILNDIGDGGGVEAQGIDAAEVMSWYNEQLKTGLEVVREPTDKTFPTRVQLSTRDGVSVGILVLGPRPDGSLIGRDAAKSLSASASALATAIYVVRERTIREDDLQARLRALQSRVDAVAGSPAGRRR